MSKGEDVEQLNVVSKTGASSFTSWMMNLTCGNENKKEDNLKSVSDYLLYNSNRRYNLKIMGLLISWSYYFDDVRGHFK